jgi:hypothetical protein
MGKAGMRMPTFGTHSKGLYIAMGGRQMKIMGRHLKCSHGSESSACRAWAVKNGQHFTGAHAGLWKSLNGMEMCSKDIVHILVLDAAAATHDGTKLYHCIGVCILRRVFKADINLDVRLIPSRRMSEGRVLLTKYLRSWIWSHGTKRLCVTLDLLQFSGQRLYHLMLTLLFVDALTCLQENTRVPQQQVVWKC